MLYYFSNLISYIFILSAGLSKGFLQRKLAVSVSMQHTITMDPTLSAVRIQEKAGPMDTDYSLVIGRIYYCIVIV